MQTAPLILDPEIEKALRSKIEEIRPLFLQAARLDIGQFRLAQTVVDDCLGGVIVNVAHDIGRERAGLV